MPTLRYTADELRQLRNSPLVKKPDNLPPIEQWIEYVYADGKSSEKLRIPHSEAQQPQAQDRATNNNKTNTRQPRAQPADASPMGNFSTAQRPSLLQTRTTGSRSDDVVLAPPKTAFASSRSITRLPSYNDASATATDSNGEDLDVSRTRPFGDRQQQQRKNPEKDLRGERESWTATRDRRAVEGDNTRGDSNVGMRNPRERTAWPSKDEKSNGDRQGAWRDGPRRWDRNDVTASAPEPEWFDEPVKSDQEDFGGMSMPKTQEDFLKWKAEMAAKDGITPAKDVVPVMLQKDPPKQRESLNLAGVVDKPFGFALKSPEPTEQAAGKPTNKVKPSRFASMFKKDDSQEIMSPPPELPPPINPAAIEPVTDKKEDKEGFMRILQMLGGTNGNAAVSPTNGPKSPVRNSANGSRQRSRFFDSAPKSPEPMEAPPLPAAFDASHQRMHNREASTAFSPLPPHSQHQRINTLDARPAGDDVPPKTSTPENNIQNLLAGQGTKPPRANNSRDTAFLLDLLQGNSAAPPAQQTRPEPPFSLWLDQTHAPKPRAPPPLAHIDDHLLRNAPQPQPGLPLDARQMQRAPPGFDEQALFAQQFRRNFSEQMQPPFDPRTAAPPMHKMPQQGQMAPGQVRDLSYMPSGPPPGFPSNMRHPQGFANTPNIFQTAQPSQSQRQPLPPAYLPAMPPGQTGPPPGFARGMPPPQSAPPGLSMLGHDARAPNRGEPDGLYEQRR